jgi:hypothetical protein
VDLAEQKLSKQTQKEKHLDLKAAALLSQTDPQAMATRAKMQAQITLLEQNKRRTLNQSMARAT